jgi:hypothetical protein
VDGTGSGSCPVADISDTEPLTSAIRPIDR